MVDNVIHIFYVFTELFCLIGLSMSGEGVLNSPTIIVGLSLFPLNSVIICSIYFEALLLDTYTHLYLKILPMNWIFYHYETSLFTLVTLCLEIYFISYQHSYSSFLRFTVCMEYILLSTYFQSTCVFRCKTYLM